MEIKSTADITLEELQRLSLEKGKEVIVISGSENGRYSIDEFISIKKAILEFLKDVPKKDPNDPDSEKKIFSYIYTKIAYNIKYDELASEYSELVGYGREMTEDYVKRASNLCGAILNGKALCSGYAETLRNLLAEMGIEAKCIGGGSSTKGEAKEKNMDSHAWNQVKLDGVWYHCDITNDADFILADLVAPHFLKSTEDCTRVTKFPPKEGFVIEQTGKSIDEDIQYKLLTQAKSLVIEEMEAKKAAAEAANTKEKRRPKFIDWITKVLGLKKTKQMGEE